MPTATKSGHVCDWITGSGKCGAIASHYVKGNGYSDSAIYRWSCETHYPEHLKVGWEDAEEKEESVPIDLEETTHYCQVWKNEMDGSGGGFSKWGECSNKVASHHYRHPAHEITHRYTCDLHNHIYLNNNWIEVPMSANGNPSPITQFTKFADKHFHQTKTKNRYFCEHSIPGTGADGTDQHFGNVYALKNPFAEEHYHKYACENHAVKYIREGFLAYEWGTIEDSIEHPEGVLPPELRKYLATCLFASPKCKGPIVYEHLGWSSGKWKPVCEAHYKYGISDNGHPERYRVSQAFTPVSGKLTRDKVAAGTPIRTQKARGLTTLKKYSFPVPGFKVYDVEGCEPSTLTGNFVRPCPMRPRHGFVDSRPIETTEDAELIIKQTLEADPEAEFLIMNYIDAPYSGIWTPGYLAIGQGTDGATAGKTAVTVPMLGDFLGAVRPDYASPMRKEANITDAPYVELLWKKVGLLNQFNPQTVQLRDGPKLPENSSEFIPEKIEVKHILIAEGDLLVWEEKMRHTEPGTVVYHPGGSMASHYAVHAVLNKIPVVISREPKLGEILEPTQEGNLEPNLDLMRAGFRLATPMEISYELAANFMLLGVHSTAAWLGKYDLLLGAAMGFGWRLAVTAALGEERHYRIDGRKNRERNVVYKRIWKKTDTQYSRTRFYVALDRFLNGREWPGSNYGGYSWYRFTVNAANMYNALIEKDAKKALEALNQLVHSAHNTGWGFNKFTTQNEMDLTARNPVYSGIKVGPYLYQLLTADIGVVKTAARTFWKRLPMKLPEDMGTGINHPDEDDDEEEHLIKPKHLYDPECKCKSCRAHAFIQAKTKPQKVVEAQAKVIEENHAILHIQYKTEESLKIGKKAYFTKNMPMPEDLKKVFEKDIAEVSESYAGSGTKYLKLLKGNSIDGEMGWGLNGGTAWHNLLNEEVIPNYA